MEAVMGTPAKELDKKAAHGRYSYADYQAWPDGERWEIIDGEAWCMTPAPTTTHQGVLVRLTARVGALFERGPCTLFVAPTDVVFDEENVVQPDLLVVCDEKKITVANIQGAPDLVVEILSPHTSLKDRREKKALYEKFGVSEYLLVHPTDEILERFCLVAGAYQLSDVFNWNEVFRSYKFPELTLNLWEIFGKDLSAYEKAQPRPGEGR